MSKTLMIQGTTSFAGKSFLVMSLCKIFADKGYKVAPFKAQNTSLNSSVTKDGKEIARAQALQALAAGVEPAVEMNPILIKPKGESRSQLVVNGKPLRDIEARKYYEEFVLTQGMQVIKKAFKKLERKYELIIIEGAGSPAEINLYEQDVANMKIAELANAPVILTADIERGGVFASIYGTLNLLKEEHRERVKGLVINKFRGDEEILKPGIEMIQELTGKPVLGVIPFIKDLQLPDEDSVSLALQQPMQRGSLDVAVIRLPRISNFTDFDPLIYEGLNVRYVERAEQLGQQDAVILPGTKNTVEDLLWLKERGFEEKIKALHVPVIGICGGYQILGKRIIDSGIESRKGVFKGLGLLDVETRFEKFKKKTEQVEGKIIASHGIFITAKGKKISGYEIHMGKTTLGKNATPIFNIKGKREGATDSAGLVVGTYLHGLFDSPSFRKSFIEFIQFRSRKKKSQAARSADVREAWMRSIKRAAQVVRNSVDMRAIKKIIEAQDE